MTPGAKIGHYEIRSKIGEGGMGEVYRARDTRLDREVAIKILPKNYSTDQSRLKRFEQEARATSALNHPNILTVFDIGTYEGAPFIVSELLAGQELREQLKDGPLTQRSAIDFAQQITQGLAAAHNKGITHRDLKPENLFVTTDGRLKILDFGLAKLRPQRNEPISSEVATAKQITDPGTVMGTVGYMSPEQVRGQDADYRSDIFSFGSILYEMLTSERAFHRETMAETMTAILKEEPPDLSEINDKINPALIRIVCRCLEKNPERRFQSASDLGFAIEASTAISSGSQIKPEISSIATDAGSRRRTWPLAAAIIVGLLVVASVGFLIGRSWFRTSTSSPVRRVTIPLSTPLAMAKYCPLGIGRRAIAISPDGSSLVFAGEQNGKSQLFIRPLDSFDARPILGTEGAYAPFFSPDGQSIAFFASNTLQKTSLSGGQPVKLAEARNSQGGTWANNTIVFADAEGTRLVSIPASGGEPKTVGTLALLKQPDWGFGNPEFLPDGETVLLTVWRSANPDNYRLAAFSLKAGKLQILLDGGIDAHYLTTGHLVYSRGATLMAVPFDVGTARTTGSGVTLVDGVRSEEWGTVQYSVSRDGTLVYVSGGPAWIGKLVWADKNGSTTAIDAPPRAYLNPSLSPDGQRVALEISEATRDIHLLNFARGGLVRFTNVAANICPHWSADGTHVTFARQTENGFDTVSKAIDSGAETILMHRDNGEIQTFSPDDRSILYMHVAPETSLDLWVRVGDEQPQPWLMTKFSELLASYSPDGKYIAYSSDESGQYEIYVRPASGEGAKWQISTEGGEEPLWSRDGHQLFYRNGQKWMAVDVVTAQDFKNGTPRLLFEGPYLNIPGFSYDVAKDGRFLMIEENHKQPTTLQVQAIFNWGEEVKRRIPN